MEILTKEQYEALSIEAKMQISGFVGLLAESAVHLSSSMGGQDQWGMILQAVKDYCEFSGAIYKVILKRIEVTHIQEPIVEEEKFIVRLFDGMDGEWMDISLAVSKEEADKVWNESTKDGTEHTKFDDIDYYKIFPADTRMIYDGSPN